MEADWDARLLKASFDRARDWAGENPIKYSLFYGAPAVLLHLAIFFGVLRIGDLVVAIVSVVVVPVALIIFMIGRTHLSMLYEVRQALGELINSVEPEQTSKSFNCELVTLSSNQFAVRVTNSGSTGEFYAKVVELLGVESSPVPISVQWRNDETASTRRISHGDSELLNVVRVRGRRAVDFLQPLSVNQQGYQRVAAMNGEGAPQPLVVARIRVFNRQSNGEGQQTLPLTLTFDNGADAPTPRLEDPVRDPLS